MTHPTATRISDLGRLTRSRRDISSTDADCTVVGWEDGETPSVATGLQIKALASGLKHSHSVYTLSNSDILAAESVAPPPASVSRPKDVIMGLLQTFVTGGGSVEASNRIMLLRDADGDGIAEVREVFLDHLNSPFGVALLGGDLYVAALSTENTAVGTAISLPAMRWYSFPSRTVIPMECRRMP